MSRVRGARGGSIAPSPHRPIATSPPSHQVRLRVRSLAADCRPALCSQHATEAGGRLASGRVALPPRARHAAAAAARAADGGAQAAAAAAGELCRHHTRRQRRRPLMRVHTWKDVISLNLFIIASMSIRYSLPTCAHSTHADSDTRPGILYGTSTWPAGLLKSSSHPRAEITGISEYHFAKGKTTLASA